MNLQNLHNAIDKQDTNRVKELLSLWSSSDINICYRQETALTRSVRLKANDVTTTILDHPNCDVNVGNQFDRTALYYAALDGNIELIETLVHKGSDVNKPDIVGVTPLGATAWYDNSEIAELLIAMGSTLNTPCRKGETALYRASYNLSMNVVRVLTKNGCDVNFRTTEGKTALMAGILSNDDGRGKLKSNRYKIMIMLLENGTNSDIQDANLYSALHYAVESNDFNAVSLLMENNCRLDLQNTENKTAFDIATSRWKQYFELAILFFQHGYGSLNLNEDLIRNILIINMYIEIEPTVRQQLLEIVLDDMRDHLKTWMNFEDVVNKKEEDSFDQFCVEMVRSYIRNVKSPSTLKHKCRILVRRVLRRPFLKSLMQLNIPLSLKIFLIYDISTTIPSSTIRTLFLAIAENSVSKLQQCIAQGINPNIVFGGETPLMRAASYNNNACVKCLLENNAKCDYPNVSGNTAIHIASGKGNLETISIILNFSGSVSVQNKIGNTPLQEALLNGHITCAILLAHHCSDDDINMPDSRGIPPLHYAVGNGSLDLTNVLLEKGARVNDQDGRGNTVMHIAATKGAVYIRQNIELPGLFESKMSSGLFTASLLMCDVSEIGFKCSKLMSTETQSGIINALFKAGCNTHIQNFYGENAIALSETYGFHNNNLV